MVLPLTVCGGACGKCSCFYSLWWSLQRTFLPLQFVVELVENGLSLAVSGRACGECSCLDSLWWSLQRTLFLAFYSLWWSL